MNFTVVIHKKNEIIMCIQYISKEINSYNINECDQRKIPDMGSSGDRSSI